MGRSAALKIIGDATSVSPEDQEPSTFVSTLVRRGSVAPPMK
jgi:LacI family transcriptional regulator